MQGILSAPHEAFPTFKIATICEGIIHGLVYIYTTLRIPYGRLLLENIAVEKNRVVKLGKRLRLERSIH